MRNKYQGLIGVYLEFESVLNSDMLVAMIHSIPRYATVSDLKLFSSMRITIAQTYCDSFLAHQTMQDMWLLFYMKARYNKKWNEQRGEWF